MSEIVMYNDIARKILQQGADNFNPNLYDLEYRKNKDAVKLHDVIEKISAKCETDDIVSILSINLKNIFKQSKTILYEL